MWGVGVFPLITVFVSFLCIQERAGHRLRSLPLGTTVYTGEPHFDSREQFEMRIHKRMVDILNPEPKVIEALTNIDLPAGVSIDVKMM